MSVPINDSELNSDDQYMINRITHFLHHPGIADSPTDRAPPQPGPVRSLNSGYQYADQSQIGGQFDGIPHTPYSSNHVNVPATFGHGAATQTVLDSVQVNPTQIDSSLEWIRHTDAVSTELPASQYRFIGSEHTINSSYPGLPSQPNNGNAGSPQRHPSNLPHALSEWASRIDHLIPSQENGVGEYNGRGCHSCSHRRHDPCECGITCDTERSDSQARSMISEKGAITFFNFEEVKGELQAIDEQINPALDFQKEDYDLPRSIQKLVVDVTVGQDAHPCAARLDPSQREALPLVEDDNVPQGIILQFNSLEAIVHSMWNNSRNEGTEPRFASQKKMVFATKKFICLWILLSKFDNIKVSVPCFDGLFFPVTPGSSNRQDRYRLEVQRKTRLVAFGLLGSLIWHLSVAFSELMTCLDAVARDNEACEKKVREYKARKSEGSGSRKLRPNRTLRHCLKAIINTIDDNPLAWSCESTVRGSLLQNLQEQLQKAGIDLRDQLALYECYAGYITRTSAICALCKPKIKEHCKDSGKKLSADLTFLARTEDDSTSCLGHGIQAFSSARSALYVLTKEYVEADPPNSSIEAYHTRFPEDTIEQIDYQMTDNNQPVDDLYTTDNFTFDTVDSETFDFGNDTTDNWTCDSNKRSENTHCETQITKPSDYDFDERSDLREHAYNVKRPAGSPPSSSSSLSNNKSRSSAARSRSSKRARIGMPDGAGESWARLGVVTSDTVEPCQASAPPYSGNGRGWGSRALGTLKKFGRKLWG